MFLSEMDYNHIIDLMEEKTKPSPILSDLQEWFYDKYEIKLYDYICDTTNDGLIRLKAVLFGYEEQRKMCNGVNYDTVKQHEIGNKFSELAIRYNCHIEYQNPEKVFVCYDTIRDEIVKRTLKQAEKRIKSIYHKDIWKIEIVFEGIHVFYQTDEQMERHCSDDVNEMINNTVTNIIKPYDKYNIYKQGISCTFTSKQTLDEKYAGSMYSYLL